MPPIPTLLVHKTRVYLWSDKGIVTCANAQTGKTVWVKRVGGNYLGSPICVNDRLYAINDAGEVVVIAASDEYKLLARNPLGERSQSTPAVAGGTMFLRSLSHLYALGGQVDAAK